MGLDMMNILETILQQMHHFQSEYGFKNGGIKGTDLFTYRVGLDIILDDLSDLNITYGTYSAKLPNVWISNAYTTLVLMLLTTIVHMVVVPAQIYTVIIHLQDQIQNLIV